MPPPSDRSLLYIDMAYTVKIVKERKLQEFFRGRHCGGYFKRIWGVHPLSDIGGGNGFSRISFHRFSPQQLVIEGVAESMPWTKALFPLNFIVSQLRLFALLIHLVRKHDISGIFATDPFYSGLLGLALKLVCRKPLIIWIVGDFDAIYQATGALAMPRLLRWRFVEKCVARLVLSNANLVVGAAKAGVPVALNNGARKDSVAVFTVFMIERFHYADPEGRKGSEGVFENLRIPKSQSYLLYVGRLLELKHPDDVVRAMRIAMDLDNSIIGIIAGDGPMREELEQLVTSFELSKRIIFLGYIDQETLSHLIPKCVTLSPLTGRALIECALGGSPIVAYDRDWQAIFIRDGVNGYIVDFRDHEAMGRKALQLLQDGELRRRFSAQIRKDALEFVDLDKLYAHERQVFEKLFAKL